MLFKRSEAQFLSDTSNRESLDNFLEQLVNWTGTGKKDKVKIREVVLSAMGNHSLNIAKIEDKSTLQYISRFKRFSTERVVKSLVKELTENEDWSVKGSLMGTCWYKDCCMSNFTKCGKPSEKIGFEKMNVLFKSKEIYKIIEVLREEEK